MEYHDTPKILLGTKMDLTNERVISKENMQKTADKLGIPYMECSAKTGENVRPSFLKAVELAISYVKNPEALEERNRELLHQQYLKDLVSLYSENTQDNIATYSSSRKLITTTTSRSSANQKETSRPNEVVTNIFKVLLLGGHASAGKSCWVARKRSGYFADNIQSTIGVNFYSTNESFEEKEYRIQLWDTPSQERYYAMVRSCANKVSAFILFIDISAPLKEQSEKLTQQLNNCDPGEIPMVMVANKVDLRQSKPEECQFSYEEGLECSKTFGATAYIECSVKEGTNLDAILNRTLHAILYKGILENISITLNQNHQPASLAPTLAASLEKSILSQTSSENKKTDDEKATQEKTVGKSVTNTM